MRHGRLVRSRELGLGMLLFASLAAAQEVPPAAEAPMDPEAVRELDEEAFVERMREAEERLAEAAKEVAELSAARLDDFGAARRYEFQFSDKPRLGINIESYGDETPVDGVKVLSVTPGSAADESGLRSGDVLTAVNGEPLGAVSRKESNLRLLDIMQAVEEGDVLTIEYLRDGKSGTVEVEPRPIENKVFAWSEDGGKLSLHRVPEVHPVPDVAIERFRSPMAPWQRGWGDMEIVELTAGLGRYFGADEGLLVIRAPRAESFKLQDGDVILSIDGRDPQSVGHCMRILGSYQPGETLELRIMRDRREQALEVTIPDRRASTG